MAKMATPVQGPIRRVRGYPKLASTMASVPEFTVFRKFGYLNRLNLLYLQAELQLLEEELDVLQTEDNESQDEKQLDLAVDFRALRESKGGPEKFQFEKLERIAKVLKEYNEALIQASAIDAIPTPSSGQLQEYNKWLTLRNECGVNFPRPWENSYTSSFNNDQVTFKQPNPEHDPVTHFLQGPVVSLVHRLRGRPKVMPENGIAVYSDNTIERLVRMLSAAVSSLLPTICVIVLYFIPSRLNRLVVMVVFTAIFSVSLAFFTSGKKHEIFAATAAFAAVEVVFIGIDSPTS